MQRLIAIYELVHPATQMPFYVGKTKNDLLVRLKGHINEARNKNSCDKDKYINSLPVNPIIKLIDVVFESDWRFWEQHYISLYRSWGFNLLNVTEGGDGGTRYYPPLVARKLTNDQRKKQSLSKLKRGYTKPVYRIDPNWTKDNCDFNGIILFPSLSCASKFMGKSSDNVMSIVRACKNPYAQAYGYHWMYRGDSFGLDSIMTVAAEKRNFRSEAKMGELNPRFKLEPWNKGMKFEKIST